MTQPYHLPTSQFAHREGTCPPTRFSLLTTPQASYALAEEPVQPSELPNGDLLLPWQPLDPIAHDWAQLALAAASAAAYSAAGRALLALAWEESARAWYATACSMGAHGGAAAVATSLEPVLSELAQAWREWQCAHAWLLPGLSPLLRLRPLEERAGYGSAFPLLVSPEEELIQTLCVSATTHQQRLHTLFTLVKQEYLLRCQQANLLVDLSFLPFLLPDEPSPLVRMSPVDAERQAHP